MQTVNLPKVTIISGPQGCGKTTFAEWLMYGPENPNKVVFVPHARAKLFEAQSLEKFQAAITLYSDEAIILVTSDETIATKLKHYCLDAENCESFQHIEMQ